MLGSRIGGVAGSPDHVKIVADSRDPVEAQLEIHPLVLVVVLHKEQEIGTGIECVLGPSSRLDRVEIALRQPNCVASQVCAKDQVSPEAPAGVEAQLLVGTGVE